MFYFHVSHLLPARFIDVFSEFYIVLESDRFSGTPNGERCYFWLLFADIQRWLRGAVFRLKDAEDSPYSALSPFFGIQPRKIKQSFISNHL